jgi:hypothetical protein
MFGLVKASPPISYNPWGALVAREIGAELRSKAQSRKRKYLKRAINTIILIVASLVPLADRIFAERFRLE